MSPKRDYYVLTIGERPDGILYGTAAEVDAVRAAREPANGKVYPFPITCCFVPPGEPDMQVLVHQSLRMFELMQKQAGTLSEVLSLLARSTDPTT